MKSKLNIKENDVFGNLTIIKEDGYDKQRHILYICKCKCGNITKARGSNLMKGSTRSCGCLLVEVEDLTKQVFGDLTPIKYLGDYKWLCSCSCGEELIRTTSALKDTKTLTKSCGCRLGNSNNTKKQRQCSICKEIKPLTLEFFSTSGKRGYKHTCRVCLQNGEERLKGLLNTYRSKDRKKNLKWDITIEFIKEFLKDGVECYYCGETDKLGLDRIDNSLGHLQTNVLPCCFPCNRARSNLYTVEEMKTIIGPAFKQARLNRLKTKTTI